MNYFNTVANNLLNKDWSKFALRTFGCAVGGALCGYGGTFYFTKINPIIGAAYIGISVLICQITYEFFEEAKTPIKSAYIQEGIRVIQVFNFILVLHFIHSPGSQLSAALKLEIITATTYFIAIPIFFRLALEAWKDPSSNNIGAAMGVMLALASKLGDFAKNLK